MTDADLTRLRAQLSPQARKRLEDLPTPQQQWEQVAAWIRHGMHPPGAARGMHGPPTNADDERLATFFEKVLTDEERDRLLSLPGEEMQRQLQRLYLTRTRPPGGPGRRPDGFNRPRRPGDDRPPKQPPDKPPPPKT